MGKRKLFAIDSFSGSSLGKEISEKKERHDSERMRALREKMASKRGY